VLLLESVMPRPPEGAALVMEIVPVDAFPPTPRLGSRTRPVKVGAVTLSDADTGELFSVQ